MEVASPLPFDQHAAGTKRHLAFSSGYVSPTDRNAFGMDVSHVDEYSNPRAFKRRRFNGEDPMESDSSSTGNEARPSPFIALSGPHKASLSSSASGSIKRNRHDATSDLRRTIESQAAEIATLKSEKHTAESHLEVFRGEHEKVLNENRILKRAVAIQQERQTQAAGEINAARQYRAEAEDRLRKQQQLILSLRYHLQTLQTNSGSHNLMGGFSPRNPDVY